MPLRLLTLILWLLSYNAVQAGAWTRSEGETFFARSARYFTTSTSAASGAAFSKNNSNIYAEHGVTDDMTIGVEHDSGAGSSTNFTEQITTSRIFIRRSLWRSDTGFVVSSEVSNGLVFASGDTERAPYQMETRSSLLFGIGFDSAPFNSGWFDASFGTRGYAGGTMDEAHAHATIGFYPIRDWLVMTQVFGMRGLTLGANQQGAVSVAFSLGYETDGPSTIVLGVRQDAIAKGAARGTEASLTIWTHF